MSIDLSRIIKSILIVIVIVLLAFFLFSISGCSPQFRLQRLIKHHPELITKDTITVIDTIFIPGVKADTIVKNQPGDTITITKDKLVAKLLIKTDSIYFSGECLPDTIIKEKKIPYDRIKNVVSNVIPWWSYIIFSVMIMAILFFMAKSYFVK